MKDSEFIELLNLYLDHEITPADAARLEAEVLGNAKRREIYRDYCRIQKGCKLLAREFATETAGTAVDGKVVAFETDRVQTRRTGWYVGGGFAAAAACVALVFVTANRTSEVAPASELVLASTAPVVNGAIAQAPVSAESLQIARTVALPPSPEVQPAFVNALTLGGAVKSPGSASSLLLTSDTTDAAAQFAWINSMQLAPVQRVPLDEFRFDNRSDLRSQNQPYTAPRVPQGQMEWNAIRYRK